MLRLHTYFLIVALLAALSLRAQDSTENRSLVYILNATKMQGVPQEDGHIINHLKGNVQLMHNHYMMQCDSATHYPATNSFDAYGHIIIFKNKTYLYGETLHYDGNTNIAQIRGKIVRLVDDKAVLRTFNLDFNTKQSIGYFYGGGTLADKENVLESDKGYYYANERLTKFEGEVEMRNKDYDIFSDSLNYYTNRELAVFLGPTNVWHKDGFLSCEDGWYDKPRDYFHFAKKAYVLSQKQEMWADSIFYDRRIGKSDLYGNIQLLDTTRSVLAFGDEGHFQEDTKDAWLMRRPSVAYYEVDKEGKKDTLFLRADTLHFQRVPNPAYYAVDTLTTIADTSSAKLLSPPQDSLPALQDTLLTKSFKVLSDTTGQLLTAAPVVDSVLQYLFAYRKVRVFRSDAQGVCDSLVYLVNDSLGLMYHHPVLWNDVNQISADSMRFIAKNKELHKAEFLGSAFMVAEVDTVHYNQVKGRDMFAYFRKNELYLLEVEANVQTVFFMTEEGVVTNVILGESKHMDVYVKNRKMSKVKYVDSPVIPVHPLDLLPLDQQRLKGFNWRDAERPKTRYEVCDRKVRSSQRAASELLVRPTFSITSKIDKIH